MQEQSKSFFKGFLKSFQGQNKEGMMQRESRYKAQSGAPQEGQQPPQVHNSSDETTNMLSTAAGGHHSMDVFPHFNLIFQVLLFTPTFFIMFYLPHLLFAVLHLLRLIDNDQYSMIQVFYTISMVLIFLAVNTFTYYKYKLIKREALDKTTKDLGRLFNFRPQSRGSNLLCGLGGLVNGRNLTRIMFFNLVALIGLIDTAFDVVFVAICYASEIVWLAILIGLIYIYTFFDKIHSTRKIIVLAKDLYRKRFDKNILSDPQRQIQLYSACASIHAWPIAEILTTNNLKTINLLRRILIFEGVHVAIQKFIFMVFKVAYLLVEVPKRDKSAMVNYAIPFNILCILFTTLFIILKFKDLKERKQVDNGTSSGSSGSLQAKKFLSEVTPTCIKFKQTNRSDMEVLNRIVGEIESKKRAGETLVANIDKLKVKLIPEDVNSMIALLGILKQQGFLREVCFYQMRFSTSFDFESLSEILATSSTTTAKKANRLQKISFKECQMKDAMIHKLTSKLRGRGGRADGDQEDIHGDSRLVTDVALQLQVSENTDYEVVYQHLRGIINEHPLQVLFEPLFHSQHKEDSLMSRFGSSQLHLMGEASLWPTAIAAEYQHIKRYYIVSEEAEAEGSRPVNLVFFKDKNLQNVFEELMTRETSDVDLYSLRDTLTHSFHQERFIQLLIRAVEDYGQELKSLAVRLLNDQAYYEKYGAVYIKFSHFKRLARSINESSLVRLHIGLDKVNYADSKGLEGFYQVLTETIETQQRSLRELQFTEVHFDLNSISEKDFYNSLSLPNIKSVVLTNCKFKCYDAFERFFSNLADTENSLERLEINRLNSSVSAKGFKEFLDSQSQSLKHLVLNGVHKNILSRKYHRKTLPPLCRLSSLRTLNLAKNMLDYDKLNVLATHLEAHESFQELVRLDLSDNLLENNAILVLYKMLRERRASLETINLSQNGINEEGLNLLLKGRTDEGDHPLTLGIVANNMIERNYLPNNVRAQRLYQIGVSASFASDPDPKFLVKGVPQLSGILGSGSKLQKLDLSNNHLSSDLFQKMLEGLKAASRITALNLSHQRFEQQTIDVMIQYLQGGFGTSLKDLTLNDCRLKDSYGARVFHAWIQKPLTQEQSRAKEMGELNLEGNLFGAALFKEVLELLEEDSAEPVLYCTYLEKLNFSRNQLEDQGISELCSIIERANHFGVGHLNLSKNSLGKQSLIHLRGYLEGEEASIETIDLSDNLLSCLKSSSILELRRQPEESTATSVTYTREQPKQKKEKKQDKKDKKKR